MEIWRTQLDVTANAIAAAKPGIDKIAGIGITNQRETTVLWARGSGLPLAPAIVWQDRRTAPNCDQLMATGYAALISEKTGLEVDAYFSASKI